MSPRTYVGPFGRILPLADGYEPEQLPRPPDDVRPELMQLPPPPLNFGSDTTLGVTDPTKYNSTSFDQRAAITPSLHADAEISHGTSLPPVTQLLTPGSQSSVPASPFRLRSPPIAQQSHSRALFRGERSFEDDSRFIMRRPASQTHLRTSGLPFDNGGPLISTYSHDQQGFPRLAPSRSFVASASNEAAQEDDLRRPLPNSRKQPWAQAPAEVFPLEHHLDRRVSGPRDSHVKDENVEFDQLPDSSSAAETLPNAGKEPRLPKSEVKPTPKVIRDEVHPDHGEVWVYEDGSVCPKVVDGEYVNADWGVTKAGKPRKRLAIACLACREKKIRCLAAKPKCAQCEKAGRVCTYATATRPPRTQSSPSYDSQAPSNFVTIKNEPPEQTSGIEEQRNEHSRKEEGFGEGKVHRSPSESQNINKKRKRSPSPSSDTKAWVKVDPAIESKEAAPHVKEIPLTTSTSYIDSKLATHYLDLFQHHVGCRNPKHNLPAFLLKIETPDPSEQDLMLLYAMLALGTTFSQASTRVADGRLFSGLARQAMVEADDGRWGCEVCQTRLMLASYYFACEQDGEAWNMVADGLPSAVSMGERDAKEGKGIG